MIHGYKRTKKQKSPQQIKDEDQLSQKINTKLADFFSLSRTNINPLQLPTLLEFTSLLMQLCSDIPTIFNFRREIIKLHVEGKPAEQVGAILGGQIKLTTKLIQSDPKSYTIWSYRQWLVISLFKVNPSIIKAEKQLCRMLLLKDEKNFHVWNYRNWLNSIQMFIDEQILFTEQKIKSNPFNFSPYHFRSKFISIKYSKLLKQAPQESSNRQIVQFGMPKSLLDSEFECVKTAIFLNPNEEAPWLFYNWLLSQLVPAFVVGQQIQEHRVVIYLNMKLSDFSLLIDGDFSQLKGRSGKMNSEVWEANTVDNHLSVKSNLEHYQEIKLENNGRLFLGHQNHKKWILENIKPILDRQLQFLTEVLESQENKCRFASLQQTYIYKLLLQCGSTEAEFSSIVEKGLQSLKAILDESKGHKYVLKQLAYWQRLSKGPLSKVETWLKSYFDS